MKGIALKGHKVAKGKVHGDPIVSKTAISLLGSVIVEQGNELDGKSISKVLIFPTGKGCPTGSYQLYELSYYKKLLRQSLISRQIRLWPQGQLLVIFQ